MNAFLRVLLLSFTVLSLLAARWAYVRGQARSAPPRSLTAGPVPAHPTGPRWLPGASWCNWQASATAYTSGALDVQAL